MNLKELKEIIDFTINSIYPHHRPEDFQVLITLSESSVGCRAFSQIKYAGAGMDWEHKQFRIEPDKELVTKGNNFTDIKKSCV